MRGFLAAAFLVVLICGQVAAQTDTSAVDAEAQPLRNRPFLHVLCVLRGEGSVVKAPW
jgi:hypothetical protein